jgi:hypothetical protein
VKTKLITILLTVFLLTSCKTEKEERFRNLISGEWSFVKTEKGKKTINPDNVFPPTLMHGSYRNGYIFFPGNTCEDKLGYFKRVDGKRVFLGTKTKYKIEEDSLKILNLIDSTWKSTKIICVTSDTLTLITKDSTLIKYAKAHYKIDNNKSFDKIIVSSSPCFGPCDINNTSIDKNGDVLFWGQRNNTLDGLFSSKVNKQVYANIEQDFIKSEIDTINEEPIEDCSDCQTISITFIKNNKIYKTIKDRSHQAPREFYWAYMPLRFLYQTIDLKPLIGSKYEQLSISHISFETNREICDLIKSESFYLISELFNSKEVSQPFKRKYIIKYWGKDEKLKKIYTDGRYYQLEDENKTVTFDLGYNFMTRNNLSKKFRPKNQYDD